MALGDDYIDLDELKARLFPNNTPDGDVDTQLTDAIESSTGEINRCCHRDFNDAETVSARTYFPFAHPDYGPTIQTDDFSTTEGLIVACGDQIFTLDALTLTPLNGLMQSVPWPFTAIHADFPKGSRVTVTARWGWAAVPKPVKQAAYLFAQDTWQMKDQRLGIAGSDQFGQVITIKDNRPAYAKLKKYVRDAILMDS